MVHRCHSWVRLLVASFLWKLAWSLLLPWKLVLREEAHRSSSGASCPVSEVHGVLWTFTSVELPRATATACNVLGGLRNQTQPSCLQIENSTDKANSPVLWIILLCVFVHLDRYNPYQRPLMFHKSKIMKHIVLCQISFSFSFSFFFSLRTWKITRNTNCLSKLPKLLNSSCFKLFYMFEKPRIFNLQCYVSLSTLYCVLSTRQNLGSLQNWKLT